jgi:hypothetical protein
VTSARSWTWSRKRYAGRAAGLPDARVTRHRPDVERSMTSLSIPAFVHRPPGATGGDGAAYGLSAAPGSSPEN